MYSLVSGSNTCGNASVNRSEAKRTVVGRNCNFGLSVFLKDDICVTVEQNESLPGSKKQLKKALSHPEVGNTTSFSASTEFLRNRLIK